MECVLRFCNIAYLCISWCDSVICFCGGMSYDSHRVKR